MKTCTRCKESKPSTTEYFHKKDKGLTSHCKVCRNAHKRDYREKNKEVINAKQKFYDKGNIEKRKNRYEKNKDSILKKQSEYNKANKEKRRAYLKANREKIRNRGKTYREKHKDRINQRVKKMRATNPNLRISHSLRERMRSALIGKCKSASTMELLGCSIEQLKEHLEYQFKESMTWDNYGYFGWHIDHIRPCASFDLNYPDQQKECFHYTNLQPLWAEENLSKNKYSIIS